MVILVFSVHGVNTNHTNNSAYTYKIQYILQFYFRDLINKLEKHLIKYSYVIAVQLTDTATWNIFPLACGLPTVGMQCLLRHSIIEAANEAVGAVA